MTKRNTPAGSMPTVAVLPKGIDNSSVSPRPASSPAAAVIISTPMAGVDGSLTARQTGKHPHAPRATPEAEPVRYDAAREEERAGLEARVADLERKYAQKGKFHQNSRRVKEDLDDARNALRDFDRGRE